MDASLPFTMHHSIHTANIPSMPHNITMKKRKNAGTMAPLSPAVPSPLTPPATGEAKTMAGSSSDRGSGSRLPHPPADLSLSPTPDLPFHRQQPIRDSPRNPFLVGGPADVGLTGPQMWQARKRLAQLPVRQRGRMTYVFRGQRVTYAEPYASEESDDEDELDDGNPMLPAYAPRERTLDRLRPRLLFPHAMAKGMAATQKNMTPMATPPSTKKRQTAEAVHANVIKRSRQTTAISAHANLLDHLMRTGWHSEWQGGEEEADTEVEEQQDEDEVADVLASSPTSQDDEDRLYSSGDEEEEDDNPFLDAMPAKGTMVTTTGRPMAGRPSIAGQHIHRPRGHAHTLAHAMHVPAHLKARRP